MKVTMNGRAVLAALLLLLPRPASPTTVAPAFIQSWDSIQLPLGLAMGDNDRVFVPNEYNGNSFFRIFNTTGTLLGDAPGPGVEAYGVALLSDRSLVVADYYGCRVSRFTQAGGFISSFPTSGARAAYLAVDGSDNIYVTDDPGDLVRKFSSTGTPLAAWSSPHPSGIVFANGHVYVAGLFTGVISVYDTDGHAIGSFPAGNRPEQLATDAFGRIYCALFGEQRLACFDAVGTPLWSLGPAIPGYGFTPRFISVATRPDGLVLAGDFDHTRVLVFEYPSVVPAANSSWGRVKRLFR